MEREHFWFQGRGELLKSLLRGRVGPGTVVLDAGCGTGSMLAELRRQGADVVGIDALPEAVALAEATCPEARVELGDVTALPFPAESFDGVVFLDVLEHVDDRCALAEAVRVLRRGGFLALSVPACPRLWSRRDELAGHLRRYQRRGLHMRLEEAGLRVERLTHYQLVLFPLIAATRLLGRRRAAWLEREERVPPTLGRALAAVNRLEARLAARLSLPIGSSLVGIAVKP
jgi:SAM-dependent methyltransferase